MTQAWAFQNQVSDTSSPVTSHPPGSRLLKLGAERGSANPVCCELLGPQRKMRERGGRSMPRTDPSLIGRIMHSSQEWGEEGKEHGVSDLPTWEETLRLGDILPLTPPFLHYTSCAEKSNVLGSFSYQHQNSRRQFSKYFYRCYLI